MKTILISILVLGLEACANLNTIRESRGSGTTKAFASDVPKVYAEARNVLRVEGFEIIEESPDYIGARFVDKIGGTAFFGVWVDRLPSGCTVTALSKKQTFLTISGLSESDFLSRLAVRAQ